MTEEANQPEQGFFNKYVFPIIRFYVMMQLLNYFLKFNGTTNSQTDQSLPVNVTKFHPLWEQDSIMSISVYLGNKEYDSSSTLVYENKELIYGNYIDSNNVEAKVKVPSNIMQLLRNNQTVYTHAVFRSESESILRSKPLNQYFKRRKTSATKNLISGEEVSKDQEEQYLSHINPNMTINWMGDYSQIPAKLPPALSQLVKVRNNRYTPIVYFNDFWTLKEDFIPLNDSVKNIVLNLHLSPISFLKLSLYTQFEESFKAHERMGDFTGSGSQVDEIKRMLRDTNPILLGITIAVSLLHSIFDFLAFKNDIQFWNKQQSLEGLSIRSIAINVFFQFVTFLYLLDNDTSAMILLSAGVGLAIEIWKLTKTLDFKRIDTFPYLSWTEKASYSNKTKEYDDLAMRYLMYLAYPLFGSYAIYSLMYESHKSWYSYIVSTVVGFIYVYGFLMMTPQLFINYKLKSVAHMPWKTFMYKALNTVVDDLFAFVIKMPILHRLACFRDDVVFLVYLYQWWVYPVDKKRPNEFGQVAEPEESKNNEKHETKEKAKNQIEKDNESSSSLRSRKKRVKE